MEVHNGWIRYTELQDPDKGPTIGELSLAQDKNRKYNDHSSSEQVAEHLKGFVGQVEKCVKNGKKHFDDNFYIEVLVCMSRIVPDHTKNIFAARKTCPTPFYDQIVYKYHANVGDVEFLWCVPDVDTCKRFRYLIETVPDEDKDLQKMVLDYYNGELAKIEYSENNPEEKIILT